MNELKIFENPEFGEVRTVLQDGEVWFLLVDVCKVLDLLDTNKVSERLDDDELTRIKFVSGGQTREMYAVSESGLYSVILRSDKPKAKPFRRWVTHDILPAIRKHGAYIALEKNADVLLDPDLIIRLATELKQLRLKNFKYREPLIAGVDPEPLPEYADLDEETGETSGVLLNIPDTAKMLGVKLPVMKNFLIYNGLLYPNRNKVLVPRPEYDRSMFVVREYYDYDGTGYKMETLVTPAGREKLRLMVDNMIPRTPRTMDKGE